MVAGVAVAAYKCTIMPQLSETHVNNWGMFMYFFMESVYSEIVMMVI